MRRFFERINAGNSDIPSQLRHVAVHVAELAESGKVAAGCVFRAAKAGHAHQAAGLHVLVAGQFLEKRLDLVRLKPVLVTILLLPLISNFPIR